MEHGVQIASLAIIITILINYFRNKRLPLASTKLFTIFLFVAFFNILAEFGTLYTIYHMDTVSPFLLRLSHQLFIGSLDLMAFFIYLYVDMKSRTEKRYTGKQFLVRILPLLVAVIMVIFGKLYYFVNEDGRYSYGPMAMTVYISVAAYLVGAIVILLRNNKHFTKEAKASIILGFIALALITIVQFTNPLLLLSSLGIALMTQFIYISFENPREYRDYEMPSALNRYAFEKVIAERLQRKKAFYLVSLVFPDKRQLKNTFSYREMEGFFEKAVVFFHHKLKGQVYHSDEMTITVILNSEQLKRVEKVDFSEMEAAVGGDMGIMPKCFVSVMECPKYAASIGKILDMLDFITKEGRNRWDRKKVVVDDELMEKKNYLEDVEGLVQKAIREDGLEVYYQPIFSPQRNGFVSAEALVRLKDKETLGFISPEVFIPIAEKRGMITELGNQVFEKVCAFAAKEKLWEYGIEYIEVNISGIQSVDKKLPQTLQNYMKKYKIDPQFINLEITETAAVEAGDMLEKNMKRLREMGCHFSMDDFGTGYSNLSKMAETDFELIKLDKSLIWPCFDLENAKKENAFAILEACIRMIGKLGMHIVAEGVETKEQADYLTEKGVTYLQGYYFSRPVPEEDFFEFIKQERKDVF